ncbi:MAG: hypothetical protein KC656_08065 [Myxococcales bacterium]|nr:hypothetical protein [Myxococcales bacterium]
MQSPEEVAAALVSPWPTWWIEGPTEAAVLDLLARFGPLPQADVFEPWDPGEPWQARVVHPPLDRAAELLATGTLLPGEPPGLTEWLDRERVSEDRLTVDGMEATLLSEAERGGLLIPELDTLGPDPLAAHVPLQAAAVEAVRHPTSGRLGVRFALPVADQDPTADRQQALALVAAAAHHADPALSPYAVWWYALGHVYVLCWRLVPPDRRLPSAPARPRSADLTRWTGGVELQVDLPPDAHDDRVVDLARDLAVSDFSGSRPRWAQGLVACWEGPPAASPPALDVPHRVLPGCPEGMEPDWLGVDPEHWTAHGRAFSRWHCSLRDRDLLPRMRERQADAVDLSVSRTLSAFGPLDPVHAGFPALRLRIPALDDRAWATLVDVLGALPEPAIGPVVHVRMQQRFTLLLERVDLPRDLPVWSPA